MVAVPLFLRVLHFVCFLQSLHSRVNKYFLPFKGRIEVGMGFTHLLHFLHLRLRLQPLKTPPSPRRLPAAA